MRVQRKEFMSKGVIAARTVPTWDSENHVLLRLKVYLLSLFAILYTKDTKKQQWLLNVLAL